MNNVTMPTANMTEQYVVRDVDERDLPEMGDLLQVVRVIPRRDGWLGARIVLEPLGVRILKEDTGDYGSEP